MNKYLFIYRSPVSNNPPPSPEEMQGVFARWNLWKDNFKESILSIGDGLLPGGKVWKAGEVTDGAYVEAKELVGGYSIIQAADYDAALKVAASCPMTNVPGASIEVRQLMNF